MLLLLIAAVGGYLIGAIPFGYLVARSRGVNIFEHGSGNPGATNVSRALGRRFGLLVFVLDAAKGALPVLLARWLIEPHLTPPIPASAGEVAAGLAAFLGHVYPVYLGFRGGKGVATGAGVVSVLFPAPALAAGLGWCVTAAAWRYVSLASIVAALVLLAVYLALAYPINWTEPRLYFAVLAAAVVVVKHRENLKRLRQGTESRLPEDSPVVQLGKILHVWALAIWLGSMVFFTIVGLSLFDTFDRLGASKDRPGWLPLTEKYQKVDAHIDGPREQGSRIAGAAVAPLFPIYFLLQGACAFVAMGTALPWGRLEPRRKAHRARFNLLVVALVTVLVGWWVEKHVSALRIPRNVATDDYLVAKAANVDAARAEMESARGAFRGWHLVSMLLNVAALGLVGAASALAIHIPQRPARAPGAGGDGEDHTEIVSG